MRVCFWITVSMLLMAPAAAQDDLGYGGWDLLPSPGDVVFGKGKSRSGACGKNAIGPVGTEVQEIYARAGRCGTYSNNEFRDFYLDMRMLDPDDRDYSGDVVGDYETVANYFNYHGMTWWNGQYSPGYQEVARLAGRVPPGLTAHYVGTGSALDMSRPQGVSQDESSTTEVVAGSLGACGLPYPNDNVRKVQEISAKNGMCDWYRENVGADGR